MKCIKLLLFLCLFLAFSVSVSYSQEAVQTLNDLQKKSKDLEETLLYIQTLINNYEIKIKNLEKVLADSEDSLTSTEGELQRQEELLANYRAIQQKYQENYNELLNRYEKLEQASKSLKSNLTLSNVGLVGAGIIIIILLVL